MRHKHRFPVPGTPPATLLKRVAGDTKPPTFRVVEYAPNFYEEHEYTRAGDVPDHPSDGHTRWIEMNGLSDTAALETFGQKFKLHPLTLEDTLNTGQRAKVEMYDDYLFIILHMVYHDLADRICTEQVSIFLRKGLVITIQEEPDYDVFDPIRERLRSGQGRLRGNGADYLAYALLDSVIDHVFPILEELGDIVESVEDDLLEKPNRTCALRIHEIKRLLTQLRRFVWPERDIVNHLMRDESGLVSSDTKVFLRDCYDHTVQIMDLVESYRDVASGLMEMYLSAIGLRTNEIMRVLTVISSIFIPLTFVAGVYGMNFDYAGGNMPLNMPELHHPHGYLVCMAVMAIIAVGQVIFFRRKGWLGGVSSVTESYRRTEKQPNKSARRDG
jgi:magnesium transporter